MTSEQRQEGLVRVGLIMMTEAIYDYNLNKEGDDHKTLNLLYSLRSLFYAIDSIKNVMWTEDVVQDNRYWCELSVPYHLHNGKLSKVIISFDGMDRCSYMIGTVSLTVDGEEVLNGIRYVEV